jgi:hypothetical protein
MYVDQHELAEKAIERLAAALPADYLPDLPAQDRISRWNDEPGRTQDEVVALFDRAIALSA